MKMAQISRISPASKTNKKCKSSCTKKLKSRRKGLHTNDTSIQEADKTQTRAQKAHKHTKRKQKCKKGV